MLAMSGWPSGLRRQTQVLTCAVSAYARFLVSIGGVGSNPTSDMVFFETPLKERHVKLRSRLIQILLSHLCSLDLLLPKSFLECHHSDNEDDQDSNSEMTYEMDHAKVELKEVLDDLCVRFIEFINRTTLSGELNFLKLFIE